MTMTRVTLLVGCLLLVVGCSSTREVETSRPRAYEGAADAEDAVAQQARLSVFLEAGETELPEAAELLRFRVAEVRLHERGGDWMQLPSDASRIEIERGRGSPRKLILDARVPPAGFDSLAIELDDVFVRFNENSGAPLTTAKDAPQKLALELKSNLESPTTILLRLEPGASLTRTPDCRWFFVPLFETRVSSEE